MAMEGTNSLLILFFSWWYGYLPRRLYLAFIAAVITVYDLFSVRILFTTLFAPWKRDSISTDGLSLQEKFQVWMLNLSSRFIGFLVKIITLIAFAVVFSVTLVISAGAFCLWVAFPLVTIGLLILGITNLSSGSMGPSY